jgi:hypothetical protein
VWRYLSNSVTTVCQTRGTATDMGHDGFNGVVVLQWCYSGVTVVLHWCYSGVTVVLQWCYSGVTVVSHWCYKWCHSGVTLLSHCGYIVITLLSQYQAGGTSTDMGFHGSDRVPVWPRIITGVF